MRSFLSVVAFICFIFVANSNSFRVGNDKVALEKGGAKDLLKMYERSMPAVMGMTSYNETLELLLGTYLTDKEKDSIWPKVIEETKVWFGETQEREEMEAMQKVLRKYRMIIVNCHKENSGKELTKCLSVLRPELLSGASEFTWEKEQDVPLYLNFYEAFHLMKLATLQLIKIQAEKDEVADIDIDKSIQNEAKDFSETLKKSAGVACEQRAQRITAVQICKVVDVLWQEFTDICEERLKRSVDDEELSDDDSQNAGSGDNEESSTTQLRSDVEEGQKGSIQGSSLGGNQNDFSESLRGTVKDKTTKQFIYNKRLDVSNIGHKTKLIDQLYKEAMKARGDHVQRVEKACKKYWKKRGTSIADQVAKLVNMPKKKSNKKKQGKDHN